MKRADWLPTVYLENDWRCPSQERLLDRTAMASGVHWSEDLSTLLRGNQDCDTKVSGTKLSFYLHCRLIFLQEAGSMLPTDWRYHRCSSVNRPGFTPKSSGLREDVLVLQVALAGRERRLWYGYSMELSVFWFTLTKCKGIFLSVFLSTRCRTSKRVSYHAQWKLRDNTNQKKYWTVLISSSNVWLQMTSIMMTFPPPNITCEHFSNLWLCLQG